MKSHPLPIRKTDDLYAELLAAHSGLSPESSAQLNARLVLIVMGRHLEPDAFRSALDAARESASRPKDLGPDT